eukprot:g9174.t1
MDHAPAIELQLSAYRNKSGIENAGGYQSGEFPSSPIEIGLHVGTGSIYIDSVTFLIHRYKIPSKVEIFYGSYGSSKEDDEYLANTRNYHNHRNNDATSNPLKDIDEVEMIEGERAYLRGHFRRIGFAKFNAKEDIGYTSRELKTVQINQTVEGKYVFLKLLFYEAMVNQINIHNQIGIVSLDVKGCKDSIYDPAIYTGTSTNMTSNTLNMSLSKQVDKYARSSYATDDVDAILKEYGLNLHTETSQLNRESHLDDDTEAAKGEKLCTTLVEMIEKKMFQAADLDNLSGAKRLKSIRTGVSDARDRVIFLSNRMRSRAENDDYAGAASDLLEVKKQFGLCCKIIVESGITATDVNLLRSVTKLKHLSLGGRPESPTIIDHKNGKINVTTGAATIIQPLPDPETTKLINKIVNGRKVFTYKNKFKAATTMGKVIERMTKIAAEIPILEERRDQAMLEGNHQLATSSAGEVDRLKRWRDELVKNAERLAVSINLSDSKSAQDKLLQQQSSSLFELPSFKPINETGDVDDTTGYNNLHKNLSGLDANVGSKILLATKIKMMLIIHSYYDKYKSDKHYEIVEDLSSSDSDDDNSDNNSTTNKESKATRVQASPPSNIPPPAHSKFRCPVRSILLNVAHETHYKIPGELGIACPIAELNTRDKSGMMQMCFGIPAAQCFYSRHIALRASAIKGLESTLLDFASIDTGINYLTLWKAVLACCIEALNDTNAHVVHATFHLLRTAFMDSTGYLNEALHSNKKRISKCISVGKAVFSLPTANTVSVTDLISGLAYVLPTIAKRCGEREYNSATAVQGGGTEIEIEARKFIIWIGSQQHIGPTPVVGQLTSLNIGNSLNIQRGRLRLLRVLYETFGTIHTGGIESSLRFVCGFHGLRSPIQDVLVEAVDTICALYRHTGRRLEPFLNNIPGSLQNQLQEAFAEVDVEKLSMGSNNAFTASPASNNVVNAKMPRLNINSNKKLYIDDAFTLPLHVPEYDLWYCKCCGIDESDWVPWHVNSADKCKL